MSHEHPQDSVSSRVQPLAEDLAQACEELAADPRRALAVIDVDEVLALFVQGFDRYLRRRGHDLRMTSFALFGNIYPTGRTEPVDPAAVRGLLDAFFVAGGLDLEPAPDAAAVLARISRHAQVVILTAAPPAARASRAAWLQAHGFDYPLVISAGDKGPEVAALAAAAGGRAAFVDDILRNLDSAMRAAPQVSRFQIIADPKVRRFAPSDQANHRLVEDWTALEPLLAAALQEPVPTRI